jgi:hypothetical protein
MARAVSSAMNGTAKTVHHFVAICHCVRSDVVTSYVRLVSILYVALCGDLRRLPSPR